MRKVAAVVLVLVGVASCLLGLLFLVGSAGESRRLVVAALGLGLGVGLGALGARTYRRALALAPEQLVGEILEVAKRHAGDLPEPAFLAAFAGRTRAAEQVLGGLLRAGTCTRQPRGESVSYVFPELQPRLLLRRCQYCQAELPPASDAVQCPRCGGTLKMEQEHVPDAGDYRMDG
jgi:hypothetical protein